MESATTDFPSVDAWKRSLLETPPRAAAAQCEKSLIRVAFLETKLGLEVSLHQGWVVVMASKTHPVQRYDTLEAIGEVPVGLLDGEGFERVIAALTTAPRPLYLTFARYNHRFDAPAKCTAPKCAAPDCPALSNNDVDGLCQGCKDGNFLIQHPKSLLWGLTVPELITVATGGWVVSKVIAEE